MRISILIFILIIFTLIEFYIFSGLKASFGTENQKQVTFFYFFTVLIFILGIILFIFTYKNSPGNLKFTANLVFGIGFSFFIAKLFMVTVFLSEDIFRTLKFIFDKITSSGLIEMDSRRRFIAKTGLIIAAIPFTSLVYGVIKGKYDFKIHTKHLIFKDLPKSFSGLRIVQISDLHLGSFDNMEQVDDAVNKIIELKPDILFFTGDMVNNMAVEAEPYIDIFAKIKPKYGKFSILGNHDYAHYVNWQTKKDLEKNMEKLFEIQRQMGFRLLKNESVEINNGTDSFRIAGVENWGAPPFPQYGDLGKALANATNFDFIILLSHDPTHWDMQVKNYKKKVQLTLSGHTHGMQIGIEIPGFKWSPVQYKYSKWSDLYSENGKYLYVNRGFGFIGYPGRIGIWPEITVFELKTE
jgi:hypothetical protein